MFTKIFTILAVSFFALAAGDNAEQDGRILTGKAPVRTPVRTPVRAPVRPPVPVRKCNFVCPRNSRVIPGRKCISGFNDCACVNGFVKSGNKCVRVPTRPPTRPPVRRCFHCPRDSYPTKRCPMSFRDCECFRGFCRDYHQQVCKRNRRGHGDDNNDNDNDNNNNDRKLDDNNNDNDNDGPYYCRNNGDDNDNNDNNNNNNN